MVKRLNKEVWFVEFTSYLEHWGSDMFHSFKQFWGVNWNINRIGRRWNMRNYAILSRLWPSERWRRGFVAFFSLTSGLRYRNLPQHVYFMTRFVGFRRFWSYFHHQIIYFVCSYIVLNIMGAMIWSYFHHQIIYFVCSYIVLNIMGAKQAQLSSRFWSHSIVKRHFGRALRD